MKNISYFQLIEYANSINPSDLVNMLEFNSSLNMALNMLNNEEWEESLQKYATEILEAMRNKYPEKWNSSWRFDALLGYAYDIILNYDERYIAYKRALDKTTSAPPQLLIAIARCCIAPGTPPVSEDEAILFAKEAIQVTPYIEAIGLLRGLYKAKGNIEKQKYYETILNKISENGSHLPTLDDFSNEI